MGEDFLDLEVVDKDLKANFTYIQISLTYQHS